ncbi:MAG TPA: serine/threonine-protein kinase [Burkholderiaceae bacterium]|nr:serine/threonine-protein kinase [Burkholderiaceae bacterium]
MSERGLADNVPAETRRSHAPQSGRADRTTTALPAGARVNEFEILGTIGEGGFGIVYRAQDHSLRRMVALKEYMPTALAGRSETQRIVVKSGDHVQTFLAGLRSFINEAQTLARFDHPALVKVHRFCEANGTAYMAMPLYEGVTLRHALRARAANGAGAPDETWLRALIAPLLDALELLHRDHCLHRDVAPDNILLLGGDGPLPKPLLLDFGAARRVIGEQTQALTVILKPGYAPIEQYDETPGLRQGPWTDIYALAAVLHWSIAGKPPPQAVGRLLQDAYEPLAGLPGRLGRYSDPFLASIDRALAPLPHDRPVDIPAWRAALGVRRPAGVPAGATQSHRIQPAPAAPVVEQLSPPLRTSPPRRPAVFWGLACIVLLLAAVLASWAHRKAAHAAPVTAARAAQTPAQDHEALPPSENVAAAPPSEDTAKTAEDGESVAGAPNWVRENLREARQCLVVKRYACTIERAEEVLKSMPAHPTALRLVRLGREGLQAAPTGGRKKS